ncbi:MAG: GNAT family N-acetyltransferase [Clostridia bacterium]|nr:GNAT family N-acetyltransferase [Clostridia bacterium]
MFDRLWGKRRAPAFLPRLETKRLILRPMEAGDAADMFDYARRIDTTRYLLWHPHPSVEYTRSYLAMIGRLYRKGQFFDWAIVEKDSGRMIGTCGFTRLAKQHALGEVGYVLNPDYHGRGYATEAVRAVIAFGFENLELHRIEGRYMVENTPSRRVMERCGLSFEGVWRESMLVKGRYRDIGVCALLRDDYLRLCTGQATAAIRL